KPRRARPSVAGRADDRVALGRHPLDVRGGGHAEEAPDLAPVAAEGDAGGALAQELGGAGQRVVPAGFEIPVQADPRPPKIGGTRRGLAHLPDGPALRVEAFEPHALLLFSPPASPPGPPPPPTGGESDGSRMARFGPITPGRGGLPRSWPRRGGRAA